MALFYLQFSLAVSFISYGPSTPIFPLVCFAGSKMWMFIVTIYYHLQILNQFSFKFNQACWIFNACVSWIYLLFEMVCNTLSDLTFRSWDCNWYLWYLSSYCGKIVILIDLGEVYTWGDNDEGQLGDGTTNAIQRPRLVAALQGKKINRVACGSAHTLAWSTSKPANAGKLPTQVECSFYSQFFKLLVKQPIDDI